MSPYADAWTAVRGRPWRFLLSAWPWRSLVYLLSAVPLGIGLLSVLAAMFVLGLTVVGLLLLVSIPLVTTVLAELERARLRLVFPQPSDGRRPALRERLRTWRTLPVAWPEIGYAVLLATVWWLVDVLVLSVAITTPLVLLLAPVLVRYEPVEVFGWRIESTGEAAFAVAAGVVALAVAAYLVTALASAQAALTRLLLDPPEARLVAAVTELRRSRAGLVDAFEAERRRIERDLHDGAQQRLVALTMTLGRAELELAGGPALDLVTQAHSLAEEALEDLRATVRGIHPQVLTDHGLGPAIHELAARSPVPVDTDLHLPGQRLPARVETAAYFLVSEALTNIARHSSARTAQVHAWVADDALTVIVVDDGHGGADPSRGTGLAGLAARIDAVDGVLDISSPPGGPTHVRMTCPISQ
ncbi:sensor domain-containing protein [Hamadaea sp. NPDC050747]|uniref:sensor histidine kinase n=1 Tax=Hamadaea sp. NPDC050747 TaxID=3155789 RepID=UPI0034103BB1